MKSMKTESGQTLEIVLNIGTIKRVRDTLKIDLLAPERGDPPVVSQLLDDDLTFCEVLECITGVDPGELTADDVTQALMLFMEEWKSFFRLRGRTERVKLVEKTSQVLAQLIQEMAQVVDETEIPGLKSGSLPESLESTPTG